MNYVDKARVTIWLTVNLYNEFSTAIMGIFVVLTRLENRDTFLRHNEQSGKLLSYFEDI